GQLWGPRVFGLRGEPRREALWNHLTDHSVATRLWDASCDLTGADLSTISG
ncbi:short-chain dehydrogenase, partial [Streptomyces sp. NPDC091212]